MQIIHVVSDFNYLYHSRDVIIALNCVHSQYVITVATERIHGLATRGLGNLCFTRLEQQRQHIGAEGSTKLPTQHPSSPACLIPDAGRGRLTLRKRREHRGIFWGIKTKLAGFRHSRVSHGLTEERELWGLANSTPWKRKMQRAVLLSAWQLTPSAATLPASGGHEGGCCPLEEFGFNWNSPWAARGDMC